MRDLVSPVDSELARVARDSLSPTQMQAFLRLPETGGYIQNWNINIRTADALNRHGLWIGEQYGRSFTPLGLKVRAALLAPVDATPREAEGFEARRAGSAVPAKQEGAQPSPPTPLKGDYE